MSSRVDLLALLVAGHLLADFAFQTRRMVEGKERPGWLVLHGAMVALVQAAVALPFLSLRALPLIAGLAVAHAAIDRMKAAAARPSPSPPPAPVSVAPSPSPSPTPVPPRYARVNNTGTLGLKEVGDKGDECVACN